VIAHYKDEQRQTACIKSLCQQDHKKYRVLTCMTPLGITPKRIASSLKLGSAMVYERAKHMNSLSADTMLKVEQYYLITLA